jgi:phosphatidylethanolamine-binding protein (PEBP) family uncharacterized protein
MLARTLSMLLLLSLPLGLSAGCTPSYANPVPTLAVLATATSSEQPSAPSVGKTFALSSPVMSEGGALAAEYTCDGESATPPLQWSGAPEGTQSFAVIMHHVPTSGDAHWYWVVFGIPATVLELPKNSLGLGILGTNSVNGNPEFAPPCSKGPGKKVYTYTVYALSAQPRFSVLKVTRDVLLEAIKDITLASAELNVSYTR